MTVKTLFTCQPFKFTFLLSRHLATNYFGLGRLFHRSSNASSEKFYTPWRPKWSQLGGLLADLFLILRPLSLIELIGN